MQSIHLKCKSESRSNMFGHMCYTYHQKQYVRLKKQFWSCHLNLLGLDIWICGNKRQQNNLWHSDSLWCPNISSLQMWSATCFEQLCLAYWLSWLYALSLTICTCLDSCELSCGALFLPNLTVAYWQMRVKGEVWLMGKQVSSMKYIWTIDWGNWFARFLFCLLKWLCPKLTNLYIEHWILEYAHFFVKRLCPLALYLVWSVVKF